VVGRYLRSAGFWLLMSYVGGVVVFLYLGHQNRVEIKRNQEIIRIHCVSENELRTALRQLTELSTVPEIRHLGQSLLSNRDCARL
jgi:hypothetical protein